MRLLYRVYMTKKSFYWPWKSGLYVVGTYDNRERAERAMADMKRDRSIVEFELHVVQERVLVHISVIERSHVHASKDGDWSIV